MCLASKFAGISVGIATLAQVADPGTIATGAYEKFGLTGLLILVVIALWIDGKREAAKAEERRTKRDEKDDERHAAFISALSGIKTSIDTNAVKCDTTRSLAQDALKHRE